MLFWITIKSAFQSLIANTLRSLLAMLGIIIGTGAQGCCRVLDEVTAFCKHQGIELLTLPTPEAVVEYNSLEEKGSTIAFLHLTC